MYIAKIFQKSKIIVISSNSQQIRNVYDLSGLRLNPISQYL